MEASIIAENAKEYGCLNKRWAILSTCFGSLSMIMVQDSAVIILFTAMLNMNGTISMLTTAAPGLMNCFFLVPAAFFVSRTDYKKSINISCWWGAVSILFIVFSPYVGKGTSVMLLTGVFSFGASLALYFSAWVPFMTDFLSLEETSSFLGMKRFCWLTTSVLFFFCCGLFLTGNPPLWRLQLVIAVTALALFGRMFFVDKIQTCEHRGNSVSIISGFKMFLANKLLLRFSLYAGLLYLSANSTVPLALIFLKKNTSLHDNTIVLISSLVIGGMLAGFLFCGRFSSNGVRKNLLMVQYAFVFICMGLFIVAGSTPLRIWIMVFLLIMFGFFSACASVAIGSEIMRLATPYNKTVDIAFASALYAGGVGGSRLLSSLLIGLDIFQDGLRVGDMEIGQCQILWFGCAIGVTVIGLFIPIAVR